MKTVYNDSQGRRWDRDAIISLLDRNDIALERALVLVFRNQTEDEQNIEETTQRNGKGFVGGGEAEFMTSLAKQCLQSQRPAGQRLSPKQQAALRAENGRGVPKLGKYWKQILPEIERQDQA
tara:strand:+ start:3191 stop:3556 length:366 start_codon:yes stop_codon:yes gene_type:complete